MMYGATALLAAALTLPAVQARDNRAPQTDETIAVARGARLTVDNFAGEVVVKAWDRDTLRVQARHNQRSSVNVRTTPAGIVVAGRGGPGSIDYEISAPAWMPVKITGTYNYISVEGSQSEVSAETNRGDIVIKGGSGTVVAKSLQGDVIIEGARGRITASSLNQDVRIVDASGDISAESNNGDIRMIGMQSASVEANTINGDVVFEGTPAERGRYRFTTHNGDITVAVPPSSNLTMTVRTYQGRFAPTLKVIGPPREEVRQGRRTTYMLGNGSAEMELESFGGSIRVGDPASLKTRIEKR